MFKWVELYVKLVLYLFYFKGLIWLADKLVTLNGISINSLSSTDLLPIKT